MDEILKLDYEELMKTAQALKNVRVDGDAWLIMYCAVNSCMKVAADLKQMERKEQDAITNNAKP